MDTSINAPTKQNPTISKWVWFESDEALLEGQALCNNWDYGTETDSDARRFNHVELPTTLNAQYFAGVSASAHSAHVGGQLIEIYCPGSVCNILVDQDTDTVKGVGILTFDVTAGYIGQFRYAGLEGEGSAQPMQTTTGDAAAPGKCLAKLQTGLPSGGVEVVDIVDGGPIGVLMFSGTTLLSGADFDIAGNCTYILADGTFTGQRKKIKTLVEIDTSDFVITVTTGTEAWGSGDIATITWTGANTTVNGMVTLVWDGTWVITRMTKTEPVAA